MQTILNSGNERMESADAIAMYMENIPEESENNETEKSRIEKNQPVIPNKQRRKH